MTTNRLLVRAVVLGTLATALSLRAVVLVQTSDPGFYNNSIGTVLNLTNGGETGPFPVNNDSSYTYAVAPDLSAASSVLGNWLGNPATLNANWQGPISIPTAWTVGHEVAVIYQFNTLGATNVVARFGVDNGIFAWLNGSFLGGARQGGGVSLGEHTFNVGNLGAGTHYLQLLLEDHGGSNGYAVEITADSYTPGPPRNVPETGSLFVYALAAGMLGGIRRWVRR